MDVPFTDSARHDSGMQTVQLRTPGLSDGSRQEATEMNDDAHPMSADFRSLVSDRKNMRYAQNGGLYTINEFQAKYGEAAAESIWPSAPHFLNLQQFCKDFNLGLEPSYGHTMDGSSAVFGLWVPTCLLLVDIHHLDGKLKGSRLAPQKLWQAAWQIGPTGNRMKVLDFCTELLGSEHPLGKLGRQDMKNILKEFCRIMDGEVQDLDSVQTNLLMQFLCVKVESVRACCQDPSL